MTRSNASTLKLYASLTDGDRQRLLVEAAAAAGLTVEAFKMRLLHDWRIVGRPKQQAPAWAWTYWFLRCGRGFGKTISAAQWIKKKSLERKCRIALVAPTLGDGRDTMVEGVTGLLNILPENVLRGGSRRTAWNRSLLELHLANETQFKVFSSEEPDRIRGPQHDYTWCEEVSSWKDARKGIVDDSTFSNVQLSTRLGEFPQVVITSTPKPNKLTKELLAFSSELMALVVGSSYENRDNLSEAWWNAVVAPLVGTRTGRQEIEAEMLEDVEGALWTRSSLEATRVKAAPPLTTLVVAVDPNASSDEAANDAGIVVAGTALGPGPPGSNGVQTRVAHGYVIADRTTTSGGPRAWAQAAVDAYHEFKADRIVAEKNNGGEMVELVIHGVDASVPVKLVSASRGKRTRAEPVATLYEGDVALNPPRVHHVGVFPELEDELCEWKPDPGEESPNRLDALVWAITDLEVWKPPPRGGTARPRGRLPVGDTASRSSLGPRLPGR